MFIGFTGKAFDKDTTVRGRRSVRRSRLGGYEMKVREIFDGRE